MATALAFPVVHQPCAGRGEVEDCLELDDPDKPSASPSAATTADRSDSWDVEPDSDSDNGHRFATEDTLLIFDWDDTVFPSSWVREHVSCISAPTPLADWQWTALEELAKVTSESLSLAKQLGTVLLVTNAESGWVELSCRMFMPSLLPSLEGVKLLSARTAYETPFLTSPFDWKLKAFETEIARIFADDVGGQRRKNIVSLGDSAHEREALMQTTAHLLNCRTKSLKFVERPEVSQLCRQHLLLAQALRRIVHHDGNLDLFLRGT